MSLRIMNQEDIARMADRVALLVGSAVRMRRRPPCSVRQRRCSCLSSQAADQRINAPASVDDRLDADAAGKQYDLACIA